MTETTQRNPWPHRIGLTVLGLMILLVAIVVIGMAWIGSQSGRYYVEATVEDMEFAGQSVSLEGLDGSVLGQFEIDRIELKGRDGVWLVAGDISVDWSPRAILSKTLDVNRLRIGDLDVLDRPVLIPSDSEGRSPIQTFDIAAIDLPDVFLAEAVTTRAIQLRAGGRLRHGPEGGAARIDATTEQGDRVNADLAWSPLLVLSGEADINGAPGGLIASLLQLPDGQSVSADVATEGEVTTVAARIDTADLLRAEITRGQSQVAITGTLQPDRLALLDRVAPMLGGPAEFDAVVPLDTGATATLDLRSPLTMLRARGVRDGNVIVMQDIALEAANPLQTFDLDGISLGRITANGAARFDLDTRDGSFEGQVDGRDIRYQSYSVDQMSGPATLTFIDRVLSFDTRLTGRASGTAARVNGARLDMAGRLDLDASSLTLRRATIDLPGLSLKGAGALGYGDSLTAEFSGDYRVDTSVFRDGPSAVLTGKADTRMRAGGPVVELSGRATQIAGMAEAVTPLLGDGVDYKATMEIADGDIVVPRFAASNDIMRATGNAEWSNGRIRAAVDYTADRYVFAAVNAQAIEGEAILTGPPSRIAFETRTQIADLTAGALVMNDATVMADGHYENGVISTSVDLRGESEQGAVATTFDVVLDNGGWDITGLNAVLGGLNAEGTLSGLGGDIAALRADLVFNGTTPFIPAEAIDGRVRLSDSQADADVTLSGLEAGPLQGGTMTLIAKGPRDAVAFDMTLRGEALLGDDIVRPVSLRSQGLADLAEPGLSVSALFDASIGRQELSGTLEALRSADGWGGSLDMQGLGGSVQAALQPGADGRLTFGLDRLEVPRILSLLGRPVIAGTVSGDGAFQFFADRIDGEAAITLNELQSPGSGTPPVSMQVTLELASEQLMGRAEALGGELTGGVTIAGAVDTFPRAPFLQWPPAVPLEGKADLNGDIGALAELFLPPQTDVSGMLLADVTFVQPTDPTRLNGTIRVSDGRFEQGALGLRLQDINTAMTLSGETIEVTGFDARGRDGGTLSGSGRMGLGEGTGTVDIRAERLRVMDRREGRAEISGTLNVSRTAELFKLGGDLLVTDAELDISRLPKPGLPTLEVDFNEPDEDADEAPRARQVTALDIRVRSNGRIEVKGRGLDALMNLDARVTGPFDAPIVTGDAGFARGRFDFLGKRFVFQDSTITLDTEILQSRLALEAVRETPDLRAVVEIGGTIERPEIELSSEPTLPEDEVLSRILFGRSPTQLSAIEAARFAAALAQLSGGSGFDLLGSVENAIGLDTLDIEQSDTGQTQLTTGKYLSDDVYVEVRSSAEGTPGVAVEWQARRSISVEAETVPGVSERVTVQWKKDFD